MSLAICASRRIASSVRCISSLAVGRSVLASASIGFGLRRGDRRDLAAASSAPASAAPAPRPFCVATAISLLRAVLRQHGQRRLGAPVRRRCCRRRRDSPAPGCRPWSACAIGLRVDQRDFERRPLVGELASNRTAEMDAPGRRRGVAANSAARPSTAVVARRNQRLGQESAPEARPLRARCAPCGAAPGRRRGRDDRAAPGPRSSAA